MSTGLGGLRNLLIDLDGVLYRGQHRLPGADEFLPWLIDHGIGFRLVTNNATLTPREYVAKLAGMGITAPEESIYTSALATAAYLTDQHGGTKVLVVGEGGLIEALTLCGFEMTNDTPDWVVTGLDRTLTYDKLRAAALCIEAGARFVATNPDTSLPTEQGLEPGAGAIVAALTATTGVHPRVIGKPEPYMLLMAMKALGGNVENTAMLGDRLDTDIEAAERAGIHSILVLTGVSTREELADSAIQPQLVVQNLGELMTTWHQDAQDSSRPH